MNIHHKDSLHPQLRNTFPKTYITYAHTSDIILGVKGKCKRIGDMLTTKAYRFQLFWYVFVFMQKKIYWNTYNILLIAFVAWTRKLLKNMNLVTLWTYLPNIHQFFFKLSKFQCSWRLRHFCNWMSKMIDWWYPNLTTRRCNLLRFV